MNNKINLINLNVKEGDVMIKDITVEYYNEGKWFRIINREDKAIFCINEIYDYDGNLKGYNYIIAFKDDFFTGEEYYFIMWFNTKGERLSALALSDNNLIFDFEGADQWNERFYYLSIPKNEKLIKRLIKKIEKQKEKIDKKYGEGSFMKALKIIHNIKRGYEINFSKGKLYLNEKKIYFNDKILNNPLNFILKNLKEVIDGKIIKKDKSYSVKDLWRRGKVRWD